MIEKYSKVLTFSVAILLSFSAQASFWRDFNALLAEVFGNDDAAKKAQVSAKKANAVQSANQSYSAAGIQGYASPESLIDDAFGNEAMSAKVRHDCVNSLRAALQRESYNLEINSRNQIAMDAIITREIDACARRIENQKRQSTPSAGQHAADAGSNTPHASNKTTPRARSKEAGSQGAQ